MKKSKVSKKTSLYNAMAAEYPNLSVVLVLVGISVVLGGVSWVCGDIAQRLENVGKDVIYQGFGICKSLDFRYVYTIASEKQLCVIPISRYDGPRMYVKDMSIKEIKRIWEQGFDFQWGGEWDVK